MSDHTIEPPDKVFPRPNILRRLYAWVLSWAESRYGTPALALISFAESSFFPIPPDVLQIALSVSKPKRSYYYAGVSAAASVAGGVLGWYIGFGLWEGVQDFFYDYIPGFTEERFKTVGKWYEANAFGAILVAGFTPIPYKVFTIAAGVFHNYVPLTTLVLASALGRSGRFFLVATFTYFFGPKASELLEKYFEWITLALAVLTIAGFVAVKYIVK